MKINFNEVLEKLEAIKTDLENQIININSTIEADSVIQMTEVLNALVSIIENYGIKVTDSVLSARGAESTISLTCEVNPMLPISKGIRTTLMQAIQQQLGIQIRILK